MTEAVVLSGGGAYGAYEVGVLKSLLTRPSPAQPTVYSGASVGAFNAALMAAAPEGNWTDAVKNLEAVWRRQVAAKPNSHENGVFRLRGDLPGYMDDALRYGGPANALAEFADDTSHLVQDLLNRAANFAFSPQPLGRRALGLLDLSAFFSTDPLRNLIRATLDFERIRASTNQLRVAATDWGAGKTAIFSNQDMTDARGPQIILASTAIPTIFPAVPVDGKLFVDGGVLANTPLSPAIQAKADVIHVISLVPDPRDAPGPGSQNTLDTLDRMVSVAIAGRISADIANLARINRLLAGSDSTAYRPLTVHRYSPRHGLGGAMGMLHFGIDRISKLIEQGYADTQAHNCHDCGCEIPAAQTMRATSQA